MTSSAHAALLYLITHLSCCAPDSTNFSTTQPVDLPLKSTTEGKDASTEAWSTSELPFISNSTREPHFLKLGNQTVDINRSFKVPTLEEEKSRSSTNETKFAKNIIVNKSNGTKSDLIVKSVKGSNSSEMNRLSSADINSKFGVSSALARSWQGTKHEHEGRYGPQFEDDQVFNTTVVVQAGDTALLDCKVSLLRDKTVSWMRRKEGETPLLLTVGAQTYAGDPRYSVMFRYPGNWRLRLEDTNKTDEGLYECQLSTHPPRVISVYLHVNTLQVWIVDETGGPLREQYYEAGSTLSLSCEVRGLPAPSVWWIHAGRALHRDATRGGIAVRTQPLEGHVAGATSNLRVSRLTTSDAGNYTCSLPDAPHRSYTVLVHVLNESLAELQQGSSEGGPRSILVLLAFTLTTVVYFALANPS